MPDYQITILNTLCKVNREEKSFAFILHVQSRKSSIDGQNRKGLKALPLTSKALWCNGLMVPCCLSSVGKLFEDSSAFDTNRRGRSSVENSRGPKSKLPIFKFLEIINYQTKSSKKKKKILYEKKNWYWFLNSQYFFEILINF